MFETKQVEFNGKMIDKDILEEAEKNCTGTDYKTDKEWSDAMEKEIADLYDHEDYLVTKGKIYAVQIAMFVMGFATAALLVW